MRRAAPEGRSSSTSTARRAPRRAGRPPARGRAPTAPPAPSRSASPAGSTSSPSSRSRWSSSSSSMCRTSVSSRPLDHEVRRPADLELDERAAGRVEAVQRPGDRPQQREEHLVDEDARGDGPVALASLGEPGRHDAAGVDRQVGEDRGLAALRRDVDPARAALDGRGDPVRHRVGVHEQRDRLRGGEVGSLLVSTFAASVRVIVTGVARTMSSSGASWPMWSGSRIGASPGRRSGVRIASSTSGRPRRRAAAAATPASPRATSATQRVVAGGLGAVVARGRARGRWT